MVNLAPVYFVADPPPSQGADLKSWCVRQFEALQRQLAMLPAGVPVGGDFQPQIDALESRVDALESRMAAAEAAIGNGTWDG